MQMNEQQAAAVNHRGSPLLIVAGAGSGKTATVCECVADRIRSGVPAEKILLLTFTRKASKEMLERAGRRCADHAAARVWGGTFHSMAARLLREYGRYHNRGASFTILDEDDAKSLMKRCFREVAPKFGIEHPEKVLSPGYLFSRHSFARNKMTDLLSVLATAARSDESKVKEMACEVVRAYEEAKIKLRVCDFDDLLVVWERILTHPDCRRSHQARWSTIIVDEFQDTNLLQSNILRHLSGATSDVIVCGDDFQSIYAFRGATVKNILQFPEAFKAKIVRLEANYRSTPEIVDAANLLIENAHEKIEKHVFAVGGTGPRPLVTMPYGPDDESAMVMARIKNHIRQGTPASEISVLARGSRAMSMIERSLVQARIPYVKYGGTRITESSHIKDVLAFIKGLQNPKDRLAWERYWGLFPGVGQKTAMELAVACSAGELAGLELQVLGVRVSQKAHVGVDSGLAIVRLGLAAASAAEFDHALLHTILEGLEPVLAQQYDEDWYERQTDLVLFTEMAVGIGTWAEYIDRIMLFDDPERGRKRNSAPSVVLSTVHSAKGLEWDHVMVVGVCEGSFPHQDSIDDYGSDEEERRLFYVACTRARKSLLVSAPQMRLGGKGGNEPAETSRFVDEISSGCDTVGCREITREAEGRFAPTGSTGASGW